jgi:hypothetical protein
MGGHAVTVVGWDANQQYWIAKNSWGTSGGENGYFKIGFNQVGGRGGVIGCIGCDCAIWSSVIVSSGVV